jgi:hypothetical protein
VWKATYRLDLGGEKPLLQGWAVVDNDSNSDWNDVELSLLTGKPVSFIQDLYSPYHTNRPKLPLAIAGFAKARTYESGTRPFHDEAFATFSRRRSTVREDINQSFRSADEEDSSDYLETLAAGEDTPKVETARARGAGDQFEFTFRRPVSLARRSSAMFPLVASPLEAEKFLVFTDDMIHGYEYSPNPAISVKLTNTTGMKLPAGPITVYDGAYAGDALIKFFPENEQRLISYGEDLTVTGDVDCTNEKIYAFVSIAEGRVTIKQRKIYKQTYTVRNAATAAKKLIIQHRITHGAVLVEPADYTEKTFDFYRFKIDLPANAEISFTVTEEEPLTEILTLAKMSDDVMLTYAANGELPADARESFRKALALKKKADEEQKKLEELIAQKEKLVEDQERIRKNLESAGSGSPHGQKYLKRMDAIDEQIDALDGEIAAAEKRVREAAGTYGTFIGDESWKPGIRKNNDDDYRDYKDEDDDDNDSDDDNDNDDDDDDDGDDGDDSDSPGRRGPPKGLREI